jgi:hypothetical protein
MNGSAFSSYVAIPHKALMLTGEENIAAYAVTEGARKHYCTKCGTPLFNLSSRYAGACMLYLGSVERSETHTPSLNLYCESMLAWVEEMGSMEKLPKGVDRK